MGQPKSPPSLEERVRHFIREHRLLGGEPCLVVAVSGGADSTCLLHLLAGLRDELGIRLHVAHLDHQLRGAEGEADADYVAGLARGLGIPATIEKGDVRAYRRAKGLCLEEAAREVRYRFLSRVAAATGAGRIATGHTRDDHVETVLMHLVRGTGTRGLRGLPPCHRWRLDDSLITVIRPLLEVSRRETADYCHHHRLAPRTDSSNESLSPLRNRLRRQLLPLLKSYNPGVEAALLRTARLAGDDLAFIEGEAGRLWPEIGRQAGDIITLEKAALDRLPPALQRHLLRLAIEKQRGHLKDIEARHIEAVMAARDKPAGKRISLPAGLVFTVDYDRYLITTGPADHSPFPPLEGEFALKIPGETRLPGWLVETTVTGPGTREDGAPDPSGFHARLDRARAGDRLTVRGRRPGDRFQPAGMEQPKKLNEFMIDAKIPRPWRRHLPLVCSPEHILWVVGYRVGEGVKVTPQTKEVLRLKMTRVNDE